MAAVIIGNHPEVWGPHYWFFMHTISFLYPDNPTEIIRKKYYDLIQNLPIFMPADIQDKFTQMLDQYPVQPYLTSKESLISWVHFMHNKVNIELKYPTIDIETFKKLYWLHYRPKEAKKKANKRWLKLVYFSALLASMCGIVYLVYK